MTKTLASILHPLAPLEFSAQYYSKKPLHIKDSPSKFQRLFGWKSLNRILNSSPVPHPTMKMVLEGKPVLPEDAKDIVDAIRSGASLVLEEVHKYDLNIGKLAVGLSKDIGEPVRVNLYLSQPGRQGYNCHYDTHDVFILQVAGYKGWQVYDFTTKFPLFKQKGHHSNPPDEVRLECTLGPGDVLYIPRGHWHEATAQIEPSMHLTVGLYARTGIDFLSWLTNELRADVRWRETFPLVLKDNSEPSQECDPETNQHFGLLKRLVESEISEPSLLDRYRKFCIAQERKVNPFSFPSQIVETTGPNPKSCFVRPEYQQVSLGKRSDGKIEVIVWGNILTFSGPADNILRYIFSTFSFNGHDLVNIAPELTWDDISRILGPLLHEELIIVLEE